MRLLTMLGALALTTSACTDVGSGSLLTSGMSAVISGEADGSGNTTVDVVLKAGGVVSNTFVDLEGDDELTASSGEITETCTKQSLGVLHSYVATLPVDAEDAEFTVSLNRTVDDGAPSSTFSLPAPVEGADFGDTLSPTEDLTVSWTPADGDDEMEVVVNGDCIVVHVKEVDGDPGSAVILHENLTPVPDDPGVSCEVDVKLRRVRGGALDPAFGEGGVVQGAQIVAGTAQFTTGE